MDGRRATTWVVATLAVLAVLAITIWRFSDPDRGPVPPPPPVDMARVVLDVGAATRLLAQEGNASIQEIGGAPEVLAEPGPSLSEARRATDAAVAAAASALQVEVPVELLDELRAEVDRSIGQQDGGRPDLVAAAQSVVVGYGDVAERLLDEAERTVGGVEPARVRRGLELMVAADRLHVGSESLVSQLLLASLSGGAVAGSEPLTQLTATWEELDRLVQEVRAEEAAPYAEVVAAELPTELHTGLGELVTGAAAGTAPDPQALLALLPRPGAPSYPSLGLALTEALTEAIGHETG